MKNAETLKKEAFLHELKYLEVQIRNARDELSQVHKQLLSTKALLEGQCNELRAEKKSLEEAVYALHQQLAPYEERLRSWELNLKQREKDIGVIIERYQRLYAKQGLGFKI